MGERVIASPSTHRFDIIITITGCHRRPAGVWISLALFMENAPPAQNIYVCAVRLCGCFDAVNRIVYTCADKQTDFWRWGDGLMGAEHARAPTQTHTQTLCMRGFRTSMRVYLFIDPVLCSLMAGIHTHTQYCIRCTPATSYLWRPGNVAASRVLQCTTRVDIRCPRSFWLSNEYGQLCVVTACHVFLAQKILLKLKHIQTNNK